MKQFLSLLSLCLVFSGTFLSVAARADGDGVNCKLTLRISHKDGSAKVEVLETHADTFEDCRRQAHEKEFIEDTDEVIKIRASYGWRGKH